MNHLSCCDFFFLVIEDAQEVLQIGNGLLGFAEMHFWPWPFTCFSTELCASKVVCFYFEIKMCKDFLQVQKFIFRIKKRNVFLAEMYFLPSRLREQLSFCCIRWSSADSSFSLQWWWPPIAASELNTIYKALKVWNFLSAPPDSYLEL